MPTEKYQNNKGDPSAYDIVQLLRIYSTDRETDFDISICRANHWGYVSDVHRGRCSDDAGAPSGIGPS